MRPTSRISLAAAVVTLTLMGCTTDQISNPSDESLASPSLARETPVERPLKGECDVAAVFTSQTELLIMGSCELSHLGHTTVVAYQTIDPSVSPIAYTNSTTYTAANGDELRTTDIGTATPGAEGLTLSGAVTVIGGTGRFTNASGEAALNGVVRFTGPASTVGAYSLSGQLTY